MHSLAKAGKLTAINKPYKTQWLKKRARSRSTKTVSVTATMKRDMPMTKASKTICLNRMKSIWTHQSWSLNQCRSMLIQWDLLVGRIQSLVVGFETLKLSSQSTLKAGDKESSLSLMTRPNWANFSNLASFCKRLTRLTYWWLNQIWISIKLRSSFSLPPLQWTKARIQTSKSPFRTCQNIGWRTSWRIIVASSWKKKWRPSFRQKTCADGMRSRKRKVPNTRRQELSLVPTNVEERPPSANLKSSRTRTSLAFNLWLNSLSETRSKSWRKSPKKKIS